MNRVCRKLSCIFLALVLVSPLAAAREASTEEVRVDVTMPHRCPGGGISADRNICLSDVRKRAEKRREGYLAAALKRYQFEQELADLISTSDAAFIAYRGAECAAASKWWEQDEDKTIGVFALLNCEIELTDQRTHQIWQSYLLNSDDMPPILPEPKPYPVERTDRALW
jgi:uncharacterized protein YecT (DUF1311 family)